MTKNVSETVYINSSEGDIPYRLRPMLIEKQKTAPKDLDLHDAQYKNDPRIKKFINQMEAQQLNNPKPPVSSSSLPAKVPDSNDSGTKVDPRTGLPVVKATPAIQPVVSDIGRPLDPRMQRSTSISDNSARPLDPRMKNIPNMSMAQHNLPVKSIDPRFSGRPDMVSKPLDPRFARQQSNEASSQQPKFDPRLSRQQSSSELPEPKRNTASKDSGGQTKDSRKPNNSPGPELGLIPPELLTLPTLVSVKMDIQSPKLTLPLGLPLDPRNPLNESINKLVPNFDSDNNSDHDQIEIKIGMQVEKSIEMLSDSMSEEQRNSSASESELSKPKLDYRNDPRFKRKPASGSGLTQKRYTGQRKSSMDYSSPLGMESEVNSGSNSYSKPQQSSEINVKIDPRTKLRVDNSNISNVPRESTPPVPELQEEVNPESINPPEMSEEVSPFDPPMKDLFQSLDPTASPFC